MGSAEQRDAEYEVWSVECGVRSEEWGVGSVECGVWSEECAVKSGEWGVWSVEVGVWSVECGVRSGEWGVWSGECGVRRVECGVGSGSVDCGVWSVECGPLWCGVKKGSRKSIFSPYLGFTCASALARAKSATSCHDALLVDEF